MKMVSKIMLLFFCCYALFACASVPQTMKVTPNVKITESRQGAGTPITVKVFDERPNDIIEHRGTDTLQPVSKIRINQDLAKLFQEELIKGLTKKGFNPAEIRKEDATVLEVGLTQFEYHASPVIFSETIQTKVSARTKASLNGRSYEKSYLVENEKKVPLRQTAAQRQKLINEMMNDILELILDDDQLILFLTRG